jgi:hypothetical protein
MAHHPRQDPAVWRALLEGHGFTIDEEGTPPLTRFWLARKQGPGIGERGAGSGDRGSGKTASATP